jgi:hypothetical protein
MKKAITLSFCTMLLVSGTVLAAGQDHAGHQGHGGHTGHDVAKPVSDEFATLDANKDGALTKAEIAKHRLAPHFGMLDGDRNGSLSAGEFAAGRDM